MENEPVNGMAKTELIQLCDVSRVDAKSGRELLSSISLTVCAGDRIGLVGASGSGKSTLMRCMAMLDPFHGKLTHRNIPVTDDGVPAYRRNVVYLSQRPFFTAGTITENLQLPFQFKSAKSKEPTPAYQPGLIASELDAFNLSPEILSQPSESLSGGEQQMIALIRALLMDPEILLLDEPTAALDPDSRDKFESRISRWYHTANDQPREKKAYVWTSHDLTQVDRMTQQVITMNHGRLMMPTEAHSADYIAGDISNGGTAPQAEQSDD